MKFTDLFVNKPVLATVVSLVILVIGLRAVLSLPIRQYPRTENAVVTVTTAYYGADPDVVAGFITQPLEAAIAQANGIDYITSSSSNSLSTITVNLRLNYDYNRAVTEITSKISSVLNRLPPQSQQPALQVQVGQLISAMYLGFRSNVLQPNQITDYLVRVVQPKLQAVPGVQTVNLFGARNFALRAWLDPEKLAAYGLTAADVNKALAANDYISGLGNTKGQMVQVNMTASTDLHSIDEFRSLVVKQVNDAVVRLSDVATVVLGAEDYNTNITYNGQSSIALSIDIAPDANLLEVMKRVQDVFPQIRSQLPQGLEGAVLYDASSYVSTAISEVESTIIKTLLIVMLVVFAFLGSLRTVMIPIVAIPLSLIGAFIMMLVLGFSINLLSLLAMVLAIGLVVDDAIIVVENVHRHINEGAKPFDAAIQAARELAGPIIAMTAVLVAVYLPIAFQGGLTGALFIEFAFTLVGTIVISTIVALTLSPMMCSRLLKAHGEEDKGLQARITRFIDARLPTRRVRFQRGRCGQHRRSVDDNQIRARTRRRPGLHLCFRSGLAHRFGHAVRAIFECGLRQSQGEPQRGFRLSDGFAQPLDEIFRAEAVGPTQTKFDTGPERRSERCHEIPRVQQFRGVSAAAFAQQFWRASFVRHQHHGILRPAERGDTKLPRRASQDRQVPVFPGC